MLYAELPCPECFIYSAKWQHLPLVGWESPPIPAACRGAHAMWPCWCFHKCDKISSLWSRVVRRGVHVAERTPASLKPCLMIVCAALRPESHKCLPKLLFFPWIWLEGKGMEGMSLSAALYKPENVLIFMKCLLRIEENKNQHWVDIGVWPISPSDCKACHVPEDFKCHVRQDPLQWFILYC